MMEEKTTLVKRINKDLDDIEFWRETTIDEQNLPFDEVVEIRILVCKLWLKYYRLSHIFKNKP